MADPIDLARRIHEERAGRKIGSIASIAGIAGAGLLGLLRYHGVTDYSFTLVTAAFAFGMVIGPITDRVARRFFRRRFVRALHAEDQSVALAPIELRKQLRAQALATSIDGSEAWPLARSALLAIVSWLWLFGIAVGDVASTVGKALSFVATHGGGAIVLFTLAAYLQGRTLTDRKKPRSNRSRITALVMIAMLLPALTAPVSFPVALAISAFYIGVAGVFVMFPSVWWTRKRLLRERRALEGLVLPPMTEDLDAVRRVLLSTLEWTEGPPALRASALRELAARIDVAELGPHLDRALTSGVSELRVAALELCRSRRHRPPLEILLAIEGEREAALLPGLLHRHRGPEVESALLRLLARDDPEVARAAAESLGLVGSFDAIAALKQVGARAGGKVAAACTEAVERIRIRHTCTPGQLALVDDPEAGALSDPEKESALLSFAEREP